MNIKFFFEIAMKLNIILSLYYSIRFKFPFFISRGSIISIKKGAKITLDKKARLFVGFNTVNNQGAVLQLEKRSEFIIKGSVSIFPGAKIVIMENACLTIGGGTFLNEGGRIQCRKQINIGNDCAFSWGVLIIDSDFHGIYMNKQTINHDIAVEIADRVWLGAKSTIQKGVKIESDVIIGSHSLVLKGCYQSGAVYAGSPASYISLHEGWGKL